MEIFASRFEEEDELVRSQAEEADLTFAVCYMSWVDRYLDNSDKGRLRYAISHIRDNGEMTIAYQLLSSAGTPEMLDGDQMNTIIRCLLNKILCTRLIIKLCAKDLLKCTHA